MTFTAAPEYQVFPTPDKPLKPYAAAVRAARGDPAVRAVVRPGCGGRRHPHARAGAGGGAGGRAAGDAGPPRPPLRGRRPPDLLDRRAAAADSSWPGAVALGQPALRAGLAGDGARPVQRDAPAARAGAAAVRPHRAVAGTDDGRDAAAARVPAALGAVGARGRAAAVGAAGRAGRAAAGARAGRPDRPVDLAGPVALAAARFVGRAGGSAGARDRHLQRPRAFVADRRARRTRCWCRGCRTPRRCRCATWSCCTAATGRSCGRWPPAARWWPARREAT